MPHRNDARQHSTVRAVMPPKTDLHFVRLAAFEWRYSIVAIMASRSSGWITDDVTDQRCRAGSDESDDVDRGAGGQSSHSATISPFFLRNCWIVE